MQNINENEFKKSVGEHIKLYRKDTQEALAERTQLSPDTISLIERGENVASSYTLIKICNALNITPNHILEKYIFNKEQCLDSIITHEISKLSIEEKELFKKLSNISNFNPRNLQGFE